MLAFNSASDSSWPTAAVSPTHHQAQPLAHARLQQPTGVHHISTKQHTTQPHSPTAGHPTSSCPTAPPTCTSNPLEFSTLSISEKAALRAALKRCTSAPCRAPPMLPAAAPSELLLPAASAAPAGELLLKLMVLPCRCLKEACSSMGGVAHVSGREAVVSLHLRLHMRRAVAGCSCVC